MTIRASPAPVESEPTLRRIGAHSTAMRTLTITRPGVVLPVRADPAGVAGPTPGQARGPRWRRTSPGLFVPADVDGHRLDQRIVEAAAGTSDGTAVTGWAALAWLGAKWFHGLAPDGGTPLPVPVALDDDHTLADRDGVTFSNDWLFEDDIVVVDGLPVTTPLRSVTYEVRRTRSLLRAVQLIDLAASSDLIDLDSLDAYLARLPARPGIRLLRRARPWAAENVWSPPESTMRTLWCGRGHTTPLCNAPVFDLEGRHLFTPDLFDPESGIAGEYDGAVHLEDDVRRRDLNREERYRDHHIELVTMMSQDQRDTSDFERRLDAAYRRARSRPRPRPWTVEQPAGWVDTSTVAARRALTPDQRARWLRWQRP